jgi:hypothetical protein
MKTGLMKNVGPPKQATPDNPLCRGCKKPPHEISEYVNAVRAEGYCPSQFLADPNGKPMRNEAAIFVKREEGTYNPETGWFWCTACYIKAGQPLGVA